MCPGEGWTERGVGLASVLCNLTLEYVIRKLPLATDCTVMCRAVEVTGHAGDTSVLGRSRMAVNEVYTALENQAKL